MKLSFDKFERYELPQVTLCNPNSRATEVDGKITITDTVGVLSNPKGMNLKLNFNAPHELSFDYYRHKSSDPIKQSFYDSIYESIQTDRYIYLTDIGYFIISSVTDSDEDNIDKKSISLKSCEENELTIAEGLYLKEGTYYLHTEDNKGLIDLFLPKTAGWTVGDIDPSLLTKPYFVEETEVDNGYNFLYTTIQDMFECIVEPDIIRRTISVYSRAYYTEHHLTDIHIAKYNLLKHKTVEENDEDKYTALNVQGKDENLEIRAVNPTGKNVIYNFEPRYSWMSPALQQAIEKWQEKCESVEEEYLTLQQSYYDELDSLFNEEKDIEVKKGELKQLEDTRDTALTMAAGDERDQSLINVNKAITAKQNEINSATSTYNTHQQTVNVTYEIPITQINSDCALDITAVDINGNAIFTADLLNELMTHIKPTDYVDEYMLVTESMTYPQRFEKAKELMDRAQSQLVKISSGQKTYSIDTRSFLFNKQFKHFSEQLCAGAIIYVETKNDKMEQLHLTGVDINFDEKSTNFTLGNKYDRSDLKALYEDALGQNSKSFSELKYIASIVEDQKKYVKKDWAAELRTLTLDNVLTSEDQAFEINNRGLIGRKRQVNADGSWKEDKNGNPLFELEQVKLINNTLVFTEDNWNTASTAVGKIAVGYDDKGNVKYSYGINGQVLIGELILGNNLVLTGTSAGIKIKDSSGNNVFYADENGNLNLTGNIVAKSLDLAGCKINAKNISGLSSVATSGNYGDLSDKPNIPTSVADLGLDTSKIIYKGDIEQKEKKDENGVLYKETIVPTASGSITYSTYDAGQYIVFGRELGTDKDGENYICISTEGLLTARNALIYGTVYATDGEFIGHIKAKSLTLQGCKISANDISGLSNIATSGNYNDLNNKPKIPTSVTELGLDTSKILYKGDITQETITKNGITYTQTKVPTADGGFVTYDTYDADNYIVFDRYVGKNEQGQNYICISKDGLLTARNALIYGTVYATDGEFTGTVTAEGGKIGGWNIKDGSLYSKRNNGYTMIKSGGSVAFGAGVPSGNSHNDTTGATFQIYHNGKVVASDAEIEGKITANEGSFGGWNIKKSYIYGRSTNNNPYTVLKSSGSVAFAAGVPSDWKPDGDVDAGETATTGAKVQIWHNGDVRMGLGGNSGGTDANYSFVVDGDTGNISIKNSMLTADSPKLTGTPVFSGSPRFDGRIFASTKSGYDDAVCYMALYSPKYHSSYSTENNAMLIQTRNSTSDTWKTKFVLRYDGRLTANGGISTTNLSASGNLSVSGNLLPNSGTKPSSDLGETNRMWRRLYAQTLIITGSALPNSDGSSNLGNSNRRWAQLYAKTATINTSDRNMKENIAELTDVHKQLFMKLIPVSFTFVDGTSGRTHIGFISQDVEDAMAELGMTSLDFAGFCKDIKTKMEIDKEGKEIEVPDLDENGNEQYLYALRYEEFIGLISYVLQDTVGKLDSIEERLAKLEKF